MKALTIEPGKGNLKLIDFEEPKISLPDHVKMQILEVGICGTDKEEVAGGRADAPKGETRLVIGHEMLARVTEIGKDVKSVKPGDLVVATVRRSCEICEMCKAICYDMCQTGKYKERGIKGLHGYHANFVVEKEEFVLKMPEELREFGVLLEPTTVIEKAIDESSKLQAARLPQNQTPDEYLKGKTALIAGLGPIGLLAAMVLRLRGVNVIGMDVADDTSKKATLIKEFGGSYVNGKEHDLASIVKLHPQIDLIVEAAGIVKLDFDLIEVLGINGIYVLTGVPAESNPLSLNGSKIMKQLVLKNQIIFGSVNANIKHFKRGIEDLELARKTFGKLVEKIITHKIPINEFETAFTKHKEEEIKIAISWEK